jgi:hypothetical protein
MASPCVTLSFWTSPSNHGKFTRISLPFLSCLADVFLTGSWNLTASGLLADDPEIARLFNTLRSRASESRAAGTLTAYAGPWKHFREWCQSKGVSFLPAFPLTVALYLMKLLERAASPSQVLTCSAAIFSHHSVAGLKSPTDHHLVAMSREIARRSLQAGQRVKQPLLASHIRRLFGFWRFLDKHSLHDLMKLVSVTLCYVALLSFFDLMVIQWHEIRFLPSHMEIFLEKTKTDQYRVGRWVLIARVGGVFCPVCLVEDLLVKGEYAAHGPGPLIRSIAISSSRQTLRASQPCYSTVLSWFKSSAQLLELEPSAFGTHSDRRGGAARAANVDVPDRLFKEHDAWRSERVKDAYVVSSLQNRLSVTANLGLQPSVSLE